MADERFTKISSQGILATFEIWMDNETGVQYLWRHDGHADGLTPLLDREGKPIISPVEK